MLEYLKVSYYDPEVQINQVVVWGYALVQEEVEVASEVERLVFCFFQNPQQNVLTDSLLIWVYLQMGWYIQVVMVA